MTGISRRERKEAAAAPQSWRLFWTLLLISVTSTGNERHLSMFLLSYLILISCKGTIPGVCFRESVESKAVKQSIKSFASVVKQQLMEKV